jgi:K319L-like, PKD domain
MKRWLAAFIAVMFLLGCGGGSGNSVPVANAGPDQNVRTGTLVTLNGSASSDADGDPLACKWVFASKPLASNAFLSSTSAVKPTFTPDLDGDYVFTLTVNDGFSNSAPDTIKITAAAVNSAPVANAGPDQNVKTGSVVTLDGSGSSDADNDPLTYTWSFTSKPPTSAATLSGANTVSPTFTPDLDGEYKLSLVVYDGRAASAPDEVIITAATGNSAPMANAGPDRNVTPGTLVALDGSGSSDADNDPLTYTWSFTSKPDGSNADLSDTTAVDPTFTADVPGDYVLRLMVNDGTVDSTDTVTITAGPTTSILDNFNRADGGPPASVSWTSLSGGTSGFKVLGNQAAANDAGTNLDYWNASAFGADQEAYFTIITKPTGVDSSLGILLRFDSVHETGYLITAAPQAGTDTIGFYRIDGGSVNHVVGSDIQQEYVAGDRLWVTAVGDTISVYLDEGSGYIFLGSYTDPNPYDQGGNIGIYGSTATGVLDDFSGGTIVP